MVSPEFGINPELTKYGVPGINLRYYPKSESPVNKCSFEPRICLKNPPTQEMHSAVSVFQFRKEAAKAFLLLISGDTMQLVRVAGEAIILRSNS